MPQRFSFRSNDKTDIAVSKWIPEGEVKAVVQIVHGMNEHIGRHKLLAEFLYSKGFAVYGIDLRGHGLTARRGIKGHFANEEGLKKVIENCENAAKNSVVDKEYVTTLSNYELTTEYNIDENLIDLSPSKRAECVKIIIDNAKKDNVLAVSSTAIINKNNKQYVKVIDNPKNKTYHEVLVQTGLQADEGMIEIISGLNEGQQIVTYMK